MRPWIPLLVASLATTASPGLAQGEPGRIRELSKTSARIACDSTPETMTNLRLQLLDDTGAPLAGACYGKVIEDADGPDGAFTLRFTARSPALTALMAQTLPDHA